jgi:ATP-dependent Lon protease
MKLTRPAADAQYDPLGALYSLLEHDTAGRASPMSLPTCRCDASQVIWITTANDESAIPEPILNRMNVCSRLRRQRRNKLHARLQRNLYQHHPQQNMDWGKHFAPEPDMTTYWNAWARWHLEKCAGH